MADERKVLAHSAEQIDEAVEKVLDGTVATKTDLQNKADLGEDGKVPSEQLPSLNYVPTSEKGAANGVATLGEDGKVPAEQLSESGGAIESTEYPGCYYRMVDGVVEWVNPPVVSDTLFRTSERYKGKPVYVVVKNLGACSSSSIVYSNIGGIASDVSEIIDCYGSADGEYSLPNFYSYPGSNDFNMYSMSAWAMKGSGNIVAGYSCGSSRRITSATVVVKFTKTTD